MLLDNALFGIIISLLAFNFGLFIYKKTKLSVFNPILISIFIIVFILLHFDIPLETYDKGGKIISFFLGPATVVLAIPMYKQLPQLKNHAKAISIGIITGVITSITVVFLLSKIFRLTDSLLRSLIPKSITTPIGIAVSESVGGIPPITVICIIITGILGAIIAPFVCKTFKIHHKVAKGIAIGTASHAVGTSKALEMGETEGAMSSLSIALTGFITVLFAPLFVHLLL
ncbi:LrgB family protein [Marinisporobacter balticus]|uniref:Putative murein hydrolase (TIGR00659 family) n=1 Tax=Marinisporobacter balticus TaxID=2018667 RepID=A0A4R2KUF7_9FIRM|nr:LrgB family protein [Marinisporobacter balticus]TCO74759.1 putative murein hydrolase (TIGR00659 family) [Marinisporobacter balticus]